MMKNKWTSITGFVALAATVLTALAALMQGGDFMEIIQTAVIPAAVSVGLIKASDGSV